MDVSMLAFVATYTLAFVGEVGAFVCVQICTFGTFLAIAKTPKGVADLSCRVDTDMRESTIVIRTSSLLEVEAGWNIVRCRLVGQ